MAVTAGGAHWWRLDDDRGAAALEFAFALPIVVTLIVGVLEMGLVLCTMTLMEAGVREASRYGITGRTEDGLTRQQTILKIINETTLGLLDASHLKVDTLVYPNFGSIGTSETFVDANGNGTYDAGETFTDKNGNGVWDADTGTPGLGNSGEVVLYRLTYTWTYMTPFATLIGTGDSIALTASVAVRNEP